MKLNLNPNLSRPDDFYEMLINTQRCMNDEEVQLMNAKLVLVFANHIGDMDVLKEAMDVVAKKKG